MNQRFMQVRGLFFCIVSCIFILLIAPVFSISGQPVMLKDIDRGGDGYLYNDCFQLNDMLIFVANDGIHGDAIWKSDPPYNDAEMLKDIYPGDGKGYFVFLETINNELYFGAYNELWKTDGTKNGTQKVSGIGKGLGIDDFALKLKDEIFFLTLSDDGKTHSLWKSTGTDIGTQKLKDFRIAYNFFLNGPDGFYFSANDGQTGMELWKFDGNADRTVLVKDIASGQNKDSSPMNFCLINGELYFTASDGSNQKELWQSDGTFEGTKNVIDIHGTESGVLSDALIPVNQVVLFEGNDPTHGSSLWRSDGTKAGTQRIKNISPVLNTLKPFIYKGFVYFWANDKVNGIELWKSNGTESGTTMVKDINNDPNAGQIYYDIVKFNDILLFSARDGKSGFELWKSDGSEAGTVMVKDLYPGPEGGFENFLGQIGNFFYFEAVDGTHGMALWRTNGTEAGTKMVRDINPHEESETFTEYSTILNNTLFFRASDGMHGKELWRSDGSFEGTRMVMDINQTGGDKHAVLGYSNQNTIFFYAKDIKYGDELWKSNARLKDAKMVKDIQPGINGSLSVFGLWDVWLNGTYYFPAYKEDKGTELWISDGSEAGTKILKDINPDGNSFPKYLRAFENYFFFNADNGENGEELWVSDGTKDGTRMIKNICPDAIGSIKGSSPYDFLKFKDALYFTAGNCGGSNGINGRELWKSDMTLEGNTSKLIDIHPNDIGYVSWIYEEFLDSCFFFISETAVGNKELWKSNGTEGGTEKLMTIDSKEHNLRYYLFVKYKDEMYFSAYDEKNGNSLWKSNGAYEGTKLVYSFGPYTHFTSWMEELNDELYFFTGMNKLWKTDGTKEGTVAVKQFKDKLNFNTNLNSDYTILKKRGSGFIKEKRTRDGEISRQIVRFEPTSNALYSYNNTLYFRADNGKDGIELWKSDGTLEGTIMVSDIRRGEKGSNPRDFEFLKDTLYFRANDGIHGEEVWVYPLTDSDKNVAPEADSEGCFITTLLQ